jgi:hypothetical protein
VGVVVRSCPATFGGVVVLPAPTVASAAALLAGFADGVGFAGSTTDRGDGDELLAATEPADVAGGSYRSPCAEWLGLRRENPPAAGPLGATAGAGERARGSTPPVSDG